MAHSNLGVILLKKGRHREGLHNKLIGDGIINFDLKAGFDVVTVDLKVGLSV